MQQKLKMVVGMMWLVCFWCIKIAAQPAQLPSLFDETEAQNEYQKNSVLQPGEDPETKIKKLIFVKTTVSKKDCYIGEPILVTYQLYTAVSCHSIVTKQVAFGGCSVIEMTSDEPEQTVKDKNVIYRVQLIRKVQLIPLRQGNLTIPPATVSNEVSFATTENRYALKRYTAEVSSEPYNVQIQALPQPQPEDFSGITGRFSIIAKADSNEIAAGESNRLQVTITGAGNIEAVTEPKVNWPKHSEHFDPTDSQHINRLNFPESGDKTFIFPFLIKKKGRTVIPAISFTFFNPELKKFETVSTKEIELLITAGIKKKNPVALVTGDLSNEKYLWFVPAIAATVIAIWLLINRNQKKVDNTKPAIVKKEEPVISPEPARPDYELLLVALNEAEDNKTFFTNAKTLLMSAVQHHLSPKQDDGIMLLTLLRNRNSRLANEAEQVISICNQSLYSPVEDEAARVNLIERVSKLINELAAI